MVYIKSSNASYKSGIEVKNQKIRHNSRRKCASSNDTSFKPSSGWTVTFKGQYRENSTFFMNPFSPTSFLIQLAPFQTFLKLRWYFQLNRRWLVLTTPVVVKDFGDQYTTRRGVGGGGSDSGDTIKWLPIPLTPAVKFWYWNSKFMTDNNYTGDQQWSTISDYLQIEIKTLVKKKLFSRVNWTDTQQSLCEQINKNSE